jgi:hypothetical protein
MPERVARGERAGSAVLSDQRAELRVALSVDGACQRAVARSFGISFAQASRIKNGKRRVHLNAGGVES